MSCQDSVGSFGSRQHRPSKPSISSSTTSRSNFGRRKHALRDGVLARELARRLTYSKASTTAVFFSRQPQTGCELARLGKNFHSQIVLELLKFVSLRRVLLPYTHAARLACGIAGAVYIGIQEGGIVKESRASYSMY